MQSLKRSDRVAAVSRDAADRLTHWLRRARPKDQVVYHRGLLLEDRHETLYTRRPFQQAADGIDYERVTAPVEPVNTIATLMLDAYSQGYVRLYQKRLEKEPGYAYVAIRTEKQYV